MARCPSHPKTSIRPKIRETKALTVKVGPRVIMSGKTMNCQMDSAKSQMSVPQRVTQVNVQSAPQIAIAVAHCRMLEVLTQ